MTSCPAQLFQQTVLLIMQYFHSEGAPSSFPSAERKAGTLYVFIFQQSSSWVSKGHLLQAVQAVYDRNDSPAFSPHWKQSKLGT